MNYRVVLFDDVLALRGEEFRIPGLDVAVYPDADTAVAICAAKDTPDVVCMDFAMGPEHVSGDEAVRALRRAGFSGRVVAMSSDPRANQRMLAAGANEALDKKAMLRSFLVALGRERA